MCRLEEAAGTALREVRSAARGSCGMRHVVSRRPARARGGPGARRSRPRTSSAACCRRLRSSSLIARSLIPCGRAARRQAGPGGAARGPGRVAGVPTWGSESIGPVAMVCGTIPTCASAAAAGEPGGARGGQRPGAGSGAALTLAVAATDGMAPAGGAAAQRAPGSRRQRAAGVNTHPRLCLLVPCTWAGGCPARSSLTAGCYAARGRRLSTRGSGAARSAAKAAWGVQTFHPRPAAVSRAGQPAAAPAPSVCSASRPLGQCRGTDARPRGDNAASRSLAGWLGGAQRAAGAWGRGAGRQERRRGAGRGAGLAGGTRPGRAVAPVRLASPSPRAPSRAPLACGRAPADRRRAAALPPRRAGAGEGAAVARCRRPLACWRAGVRAAAAAARSRRVATPGSRSSRRAGSRSGRVQRAPPISGADAAPACDRRRARPSGGGELRLMVAMRC